MARNKQTNKPTVSKETEQNKDGNVPAETTLPESQVTDAAGAAPHKLEEGKEVAVTDQVESKVKENTLEVEEKTSNKPSNVVIKDPVNVAPEAPEKELEETDKVEEDPKVIQVGGRRLLTGFNSHVPAIADNIPSLAEALNSFVCEMAPNSGATSKQMTHAQVRLFNNLLGFLNNTKDNIRYIHDEIIKVISAFQNEAFSLPHMNKNMESVTLTDKQIRLFQALLHLYRMAAVHGKQRAVAEVDIPLIVTYYVDAYPSHVTGHEILPELFRED